jgi:hypothetical protein
MQKGEYKVQVTKDGHSILFICAIRARWFDKKILNKIMKDDCHKSSACVVAWNNTALEMQAKKVPPKNGLSWGKLQVMWLKCKFTGMPTAINKHNYLMEYSMEDKRGKWHMQCNCIMLIILKKAEDQAKAELEVKSGYVNLYGINSSQSEEDPPSPPPPCRKRFLEDRHKVDGKDNISGNYDRGSGKKQGGQYGGNSGGGKCGY